MVAGDEDAIGNRITRSASEDAGMVFTKKFHPMRRSRPPGGCTTFGGVVPSRPPGGSAYTGDVVDDQNASANFS